MHLSHLRTAGLVWLLAASPLFAFVERKIERVFPVTEGAFLKIVTASGAVTVKEAAGSNVIEVTVIQTADVETEKQMDELLNVVDTDILRTAGNAVSIHTNIRRPVTWTWKSWSPVTLIYEIKVPKRCDVDIYTDDGQITVGALSGRMVLESARSGIFTEAVDGSIAARTRSGQVAITACSGELRVATDTGGIVVGRTYGPTTLTSNGGFIEVQRAGGGLTVRGNGSDAQVGFIAPIKAPADIALSGGSLMLKMETDLVCTLDVRSSIFGKVSVMGDLVMAVRGGGVGKSNLRADLNGGGVLIVAKANGGSVQVRAIEPLPTPQLTQVLN